MTQDAASVIRTMQLADSGFPSGVFAFSWGLEGALADGQVSRHSLADWISAELRSRWYRFDRVAVAGGYLRRGKALADWFDTIDTMMPVDRLRRTSAQAGDALFASAHALRIGLDDGALLARENGTGHFAPAHGAMMRACGLDLGGALAASAYGMARGAFSTAVRLGMSGAFKTQRDLLALGPLIAELASELPEDGDLPSSFMPLSDVALMRPVSERLFIN